MNIRYYTVADACWIIEKAKRMPKERLCFIDYRNAVNLC